MILFKIISLLPFRILYFISDGISYLLWHVLKYRRHVVFQNLRNSFPEKSEEEIAQIAYNFYRHLADVIVESLKTLTISKKEITRRIHILNREVIEHYYEKKQSVVVITSHQGNWEWLLVSCSLQLPFWVDAVYKELANPFFDHLMKKIRSRFGAYMVEKEIAFREIVRRKNLTRIIAMVADQAGMENQHVHWTTFLNQETGFYEGPERIARKTKMPVIFVAMHRLKRGFYQIEFHEIARPPFLPEHGYITEQYVRNVETAIQQHPSDWLWSHKRWKRKRKTQTSVS